MCWRRSPGRPIEGPHPPTTRRAGPDRSLQDGHELQQTPPPTSSRGTRGPVVQSLRWCGARALPLISQIPAAAGGVHTMCRVGDYGPAV